MNARTREVFSGYFSNTEYCKLSDHRISRLNQKIPLVILQQKETDSLKYRFRREDD